MLPSKIFMIGAPGSRWSGIAQNIEDNIPGINATDRTPARMYQHHNFSGHLGAYFGTGWEFDTSLEDSNLDAPFDNTQGTRILKSHEWAYRLNYLKAKHSTSWIMLVYRPDLSCYSWWHEAGGFGITYPDYRPFYRDSTNMLSEITKQNQAIMQFAQRHDLEWRHISGGWIQEHFGVYVEPGRRDPDTLVTLLKP
jgi:choline dehydrogenase-like flavoprotein